MKKLFLARNCMRSRYRIPAARLALLSVVTFFASAVPSASAQASASAAASGRMGLSEPAMVLPLGDIIRKSEGLQAEVDGLRAQLQVLTQQKSSLRDELDKARSERDNLLDRVGDLTTNNEKLAAEMARLREQQASCKTQLGDAAVARTRLQQSVAALRTNLDDATARLTEKDALLAARKSEAVGAAERLQQVSLAKEKIAAENTRLAKAVAASQQESKRLTREIEQLHSRVTELERQNWETGNSLARTRLSLQDMNKQKASLNGELREAKSQVVAMQGQLADVGVERERLDAEMAELGNRLADCQTQASRSGDALERLREEHAALRDRLAQMRSRLPADAGGTATVDSVKEQVRAAALAYRTLAKQQSAAANDPAQQAGIEKAAQRLNAQQFLYARVSGARGLYQVRPGDTLAQIAQRVYGDANQWEAIFAANRHVLDNPDYVLSGFSLVLP